MKMAFLVTALIVTAAISGCHETQEQVYIREHCHEIDRQYYDRGMYYQKMQCDDGKIIWKG